MNAKPKNAVSKKVWVAHLEQTTGMKAPSSTDLVAQAGWRAAHKQHLDDNCPTCTARHHTRMWEHGLKEPSLATMERWSCDGVARALDGCKVEPDGTCPHGFESWLLKLGVI